MSHSNQTFPLVVPTIRVEQPLGEFFVTSLPASVLLQVAYSNPLRVDEGNEKKGWYLLSGAQREPDEKRFREIAHYIDGTEAAFPNSIILGANYTKEGEYIGDPSNEDSFRAAWRIRHESGGQLRLLIPSSAQVAAIVDGQHRLNAFRYAGTDRSAMEMLCAIYLDLPIPYQAYLFATINFNQKKVDKSLAYELFGCDVDTEHPDSWPPEKLAVFLCRRLNVEEGSPFRHRIRVAAENREVLAEDASQLVSTATVVEGILALISQRPKADRDCMCLRPVSEGRSRKQLAPDSSPLRELYLNSQDAVVYTLTRNFFAAIHQLLWSHATGRSYIVKTVGIQASFDLLKRLATDFVGSKDISEGVVRRRIRQLADVDFEDSFFQASGKGRVRIRNVMLLKLGLVEVDDLPEADRLDYGRFG
jgi:DNA phosphorothioation-associated DGQHR protein 1